jgi:hypothetical protein
MWKVQWVERNTGMTMNTKRGYFTLEAAVFLPVFILSVLTLGYFIKGAAGTGNIIHAACDEARILCSRAYVMQTPIALQMRLPARICADDANVTWARVKEMRYMSSYEDRGLISFAVDARIRLRLPLAKGREIRTTERFLCRAWIGRTQTVQGMGFDSIAGEDGTVYVFPDRGTRYHGKHCTFVANEPIQMMLNSQVKEMYKPCEACDPGTMSNGSLIYCYPAYGEVYHRGGCRQVDKYIVPMTRRQAEEKGYTPCSKCGGR